MPDIPDIVTAIATFATALFMYPAYVASRPTIDICVEDVPNSLKRGSQGARLQQDGFFLLSVTISTASMPITCRSIDVRKASFPAFAKIRGGVAPKDDHCVEGKKPFPLTLRPNQSATVCFLVKPQEHERGTLEVVIPFSYLRPALRASCDYERTHYIGE